MVSLTGSIEGVEAALSRLMYWRQRAIQERHLLVEPYKEIAVVGGVGSWGNCTIDKAPTLANRINNHPTP